MGLWSRLRDAVLNRGFDEGDDIPSLGWGEQTSAGVKISQYTALQQVPIMAAVSILSEDIAKCRPSAYRHTPNGGLVEAKDHWLYRLIRKPNAWQSTFEWVEMMMVALLLRGNAYSVIVRNRRGLPIMLVPINPDRCQLWEAPDGSLFCLVTRSGLHEMAVLHSVPLMVPYEDIFHLKWMSTWNSLLGTSRVSLVKESIGLAAAQEQMAAKMAGSGARPGGVLQTDKKLSPEVIDRLRANWQNNYGGLANSAKTAILEEGLKWEQMTMTSVDAEFMAARGFSLADAARMFRIPPRKLGIEQKGGASTAAQEDQDYLNNVILSYGERWEQKFESTFDLDQEGVFVQFDYERFLRADIKTRYDAYRAGIMGMFLKPNEARRAEKLSDVEGGNNLMQPANMAIFPFTPTAQGVEMQAGPGSDLTGKPGAGGSGEPDQAPSD